MLTSRRSSIQTLINEFRALLICKDEKPIQDFWDNHALLRAWYRGGSVNFGSTEKPDWRVLSLEECLDDCGLAMYSSAPSVYLDMRNDSGILDTCPAELINKSITYRCFKQALMSYDGEEITILVESDPDFLANYLINNDLSVLNRILMLKMLLISDVNKEIVLKFVAISEISNKIFVAYMKSAYLSSSDILRTFYKCISYDLNDIALEMLFTIPELKKSISQLSAITTVEFFSVIASSSLRDDSSFVDEFIGIAKDANNRILAIKALEKMTSLPNGQNNPVLMVLKALQALEAQASQSKLPLFIKKRAGGDSLMFQVPCKKSKEQIPKAAPGKL